MRTLAPRAGRAALTATVALLALVAIPDAHADPAPRCQGEPATIVGTAGDDRLNGTNHRDVIWGGGGSDRISALDGDDLVCAGPDGDRVSAGKGADRVFGEDGDDELDGNTGIGDVIDGGAGDDELTGLGEDAVLRGGAGDDKLEARAEGVVLNGGPDDDRLIALWVRVRLLRGGDGDDFIKGHFSRDLDVDGGAGDDTIETGGGVDGSPAKPVLGGPGDDVIRGQSQSDYIDAGPGNDTVDLGEGDGGWAVGGPGDDTMTTGSTRVAALRGDDGNDVLRGGSGEDTLAGNAGDDQMWGEEGIDTCGGGSGQDTCDGGPLGTPEPSPDDPDVCDLDVEVKINCRGEAAWSGTADGTVVHSGGVNETWSATVEMDEVGAGFYWTGKAEFAWRVDGTDAAGCTYDGAATFGGSAELAIWDATYSVSVRRSHSEVEVEVDCPHEEPKTVLYRPLNTNHAEADDQPLPPEPVTALSGSTTYVPDHAPEGEVSWSWALTRGQAG